MDIPAKVSRKLILQGQVSQPFLRFSIQGLHADLHVTTYLGILSGHAGPMLSSRQAHGHSLPSSVPQSLQGQAAFRPVSAASGIGHSRCGCCHIPLRTIEKLKLRFVFISEAQCRKRSFISKNIKELGLVCQDFYFKTARLILYTCLHLGISCSNLIWKEMIFREKTNPCL